MKIITPTLVAFATFVSIQGATSIKAKRNKDLPELSGVFKGMDTPSDAALENFKNSLKILCALDRNKAKEAASAMIPEDVEIIKILPPEVRKLICNCRNLDEAIAATPKGSVPRQFRMAACGSEGKPNAASRNVENSMILILAISMLMVNAAHGLL